MVVRRIHLNRGTSPEYYSESDAPLFIDLSYLIDRYRNYLEIISNGFFKFNPSIWSILIIYKLFEIRFASFVLQRIMFLAQQAADLN